MSNGEVARYDSSTTPRSTLAIVVRASGSLLVISLLRDLLIPNAPARSAGSPDVVPEGAAGLVTAHLTALDALPVGGAQGEERVPHRVFDVGQGGRVPALRHAEQVPVAVDGRDNHRAHLRDVARQPDVL